MICPKCRCSVTDDLLACPVCTANKSRVAYREYNRHPVREVAAGRGLFHTRRVAGSHTHIVMWGCNEAFCGLCMDHSTRPSRVGVAALDTPGICPQCSAAIRAILAEADCSA